LNFGLIIQLVRNLHESINSTIRTKKFHRDKFKGIELKNKVLGIIGFGRIGRKIYKYAKAFGMKILINDKKKLKISSQVSLSNLLKKSDIISINADTSNLIINKNNIKTLKHNCYIVNTSRGELVDEQAIYNALIKKKISGYATDVLDFYYESNNISKSYIFRAYKKKLNVVITPHIGGCTYEAMHLTEVILAKYFLKIIKKNYG
jgi:D-3-phosphoglycerate dehydrogenase